MLLSCIPGPSLVGGVDLVAPTQFIYSRIYGCQCQTNVILHFRHALCFVFNTFNVEQPDSQRYVVANRRTDFTPSFRCQGGIPWLWQFCSRVIFSLIVSWSFSFQKCIHFYGRLVVQAPSGACTTRRNAFAWGLPLSFRG